jgi:hypothetical protein
MDKKHVLKLHLVCQYSVVLRVSYLVLSIHSFEAKSTGWSEAEAGIVANETFTLHKLRDVEVQGLKTANRSA